MVSEDETLPRKKPSQERSNALVEALVEATAQLIESGGVEELTTNHIAERAGTSVGSLYQYFPNKESLLAAVIERELARDMDKMRELIEENRALPLGELVAILLDDFLSHTVERRRLHQEILPQVDEMHRAELVQQEREGISMVFQNILMDHQDELPARLTEGAEADERFRCASFLAMNAVESSLNAVKVQAPDMLENPELSGMLFRIFEALMLREL